jgi:tRNA(Ile)-lysidine synthase
MPQPGSGETLVVRASRGFMKSAEYQHEFDRRLTEAWPVQEWRDSHVLIGVSGGPDSVAMLRGLVSLKADAGGAGKLYVAHLNHQMRGTAANSDADWVQGLCEHVRAPLVTERADVAAISDEQGDGWEAAARCARYSFFRRTAEQLGARFVAVGHTADDQVETVLHRILRGTGIEGLAGMRLARALSLSIVLVRPLLSVRRSDVLRYLAAIGQDYRIDRSNEEKCFTRNRIRQELLPSLRETYNKNIDDALLRLALQAADTQFIISAFANRLADECVAVSQDALQINCARLATEHCALVREVCRIAWARAGWPEQAMSFEKWNLLASSAQQASTASFALPGNIRVSRDAETLVLRAVAPPAGVP